MKESGEPELDQTSRVKGVVFTNAVPFIVVVTATPDARTLVVKDILYCVLKLTLMFLSLLTFREILVDEPLAAPLQFVKT